MIYILNRSEKIIGLLQSRSDGMAQNIYFDDVFYEDLSTGAETLTFCSISDRNMLSNLKVGNYVAFRKNNSYKLMQIIETEEEREQYLIKKVYCETAGMELINSVYDGSNLENANIKSFLERVLQDTQWKVGSVDSSLTTSLALELEEKEIYTIIQENISKFGAEIEFRVDIRNNRVVGRYIDVYSQRGKYKGKRLEIKKDINKIVRKMDISSYATKLIGRGKDNLSFKDIQTDYKPRGQNFIINEEAYSRLNHKGQHITRVFEFDTTDPYELLLQTKKALDEMSKIKITYEIDASIMNFDDVEIGDSLIISDNSFEPPLTIVARVGELETSVANGLHTNKAVLTNFKEIKSGISRFPIGSNDIMDGAITQDKIDEIYTQTITTDILQATEVYTNRLFAESAKIKDLDAVNATIENLKVSFAEIDELLAGNITADNIKANSITSNHIQANTITSGHIQSGAITAGSGIIADGAIGNAQISNIDAGKIEAGTIDTSKVTIQGSNGHLRLKGNRMQVFQGVGNQAKERVSVGDVNGDGTVYGLRVRGADGQTILLDENGVTSEGITDGSITNDKVSDDANISGAKLNINSVINRINTDGTEVIQGTKIEVEGTNLGVKLSEITNKQTENDEKVTQAYSQITANTDAIKLKVDEQIYTADKKDMTSKLEKNTSEISSMKGQIALKVEQTDIENAKNEINNSVDTKIASAKSEIQITTEGISQKVGKLETDTANLDGKVTNQETRLTEAEQKITDKAITSVVQESQFIKDMDGKISTNKSNISKVEQTASSITSRVEGLDGKYTELKQTIDGIDVTGKVSFSDLYTSGRTTINGANITTGTLNTSKVHIKGGTTKKIVVANDNYCVYDGSETDVNRKVFMGFRTNTATNVPSVMLGYNGINPNVDGAVVSGGTYTTYSHYPNNDNPESVNLSYGALAFKYGAEYYQFSTLNMYQNGDIDLKSGAGMYFRPSLRDRGNHVFAITDTSVGSRVPFQCTSSIYANGNITTDGRLTSKTANVGNAMNAGSVVTNRIDVYGNSNLDGTVYVSGVCTIGSELNVKNKAIYGMNNIALARGTVYLPQGGGNNTVDYLRMGGGFMATSDWGNFHFLTREGSVSNIFAGNVTSAYALASVARVANCENRSVFDEINSVNVIETEEGLRLVDNPVRLTSKDENTNSAVYTTYNEKTEQAEVSIDYTTAISTLWKAVQELKQEVEMLKNKNEGEF